MSKIITHHEYPPIPRRDFDWLAYHDGDEERPWRHGWGATKDEAIADLKRLDEEYAEAEEQPNECP